MRTGRLSFLAACLSLLPALSAQGKNCRLLARVDKFPGAQAPRNNYAGVWGMVVNGRELALVAARGGTIVYDCTDPKNPVEKAYLDGPSTSGQYFWREINSYGPYAYASSEHGALQILDLTNPDAPKVLKTFGSTAHTVSVDVGGKTLWASGGNYNGCGIFDLTNPTSPVQINTYSPAYVHDCLPIRGFAYLAQIFNGSMRILDIKDPRNLKILSTTTTPGAFTHNVWVTDDDRIAVTADENYGGCLTVYDVANKAGPLQRAVWCSPNGATVHNVFIKERVAHFSSYADGYWAVDISVPTAPKAIAQYDTSPLANNDYNGCWGCYPFQPSGVVYLSDMQTGFWIVEPECGVPNHYGNGTPGTGALLPRIEHGGGAAQVGNAGFKYTGQSIKASTAVIGVVGIGAAKLPVLGIELNVDVTLPSMLFTAAANAFGEVGFPFPIPPIAGLAGTALHAQLVTLDAAGPKGLAASRGMRVVICP